MASYRPSALAFKLTPGETAEAIVSASRVPAQSALVATVEGGEGAFALTALTAFREIRIPYTEAELQEFPAFPPSIREKHRREGKIELISDGEAGAGTPIAVGIGATVEAHLAVRADGSKGRTAIGHIVLSGANGGVAEIGLAMVIGSGAARVVAMPDKLRVLVAPGQTTQRSILIDRVPVAATVIVVLDSTAALEIALVTAFRLDRFDYTEEEIAELPASMRDDARQTGYTVAVAVATADGMTPIAVPADGQLRIDIIVRSPTAATSNFDGWLTIISDTWARLDVPIYPIAQSVSVTPTTARIELGQGGARAKLALDIRAVGGFPPTVSLAIGTPGDSWSMVPNIATIPLSTGGAERVEIEVWASADAPVGEFPTNITVSWLEGLGSILVPIVLAVRPGLAALAALGSRDLSGSQGRTMSARVQVHVETRKLVRFTPAFLPPGVTFLSPLQLPFDPGFHQIELNFAIGVFAPVAVNQRVAIDWDANDGFHNGRLSFPTTILLTRDERRFALPIITPDGIPLGGAAGFVLANDGTGRFFGHMRATGFPSFRYRVVASVRSTDGLIAIVDQATGKVFGTDSPGPRESSWDRPTNAAILEYVWPSIVTAQMSASRAFEFAGIVGTAVEAASDFLDLLAGLSVLAAVPGGQALAVIVVAGSELMQMLDLPIEGPGGLVGVLVAAGGAFLFGPSVIIPVFVGGVVATAAVIRHRRLSDAERLFVEEIFGQTLQLDRIMLTNMTGVGDRGFTTPNSDGNILVNVGGVFDDPVHSATEAYPFIGQLLVHELVHAWQIEHAGIDATFLWRGTVGKLLSGEHYGYGTPDAPFASFGLEGQASLVDEWFSGSAGHAPGRAVAGRSTQTRMSPNDPYFHYVAENIRLAQP